MRILFSELVWNISGFSNSFLVASCSFHFGVPVEFSSASHNRITEASLKLTVSSQVQKASAFPNWYLDSVLSTIKQCFGK
jgi:hypothetical protein